MSFFAFSLVFLFLMAKAFRSDVCESNRNSLLHVIFDLWVHVCANTFSISLSDAAEMVAVMVASHISFVDVIKTSIHTCLAPHPQTDFFPHSCICRKSR